MIAPTTENAAPQYTGSYKWHTRIMHEATQGTPTKQRTLRVHRPLRRRLWLWPLHLDSAPRPPDQRTPNPCTRRKTTSHTEESTRHSSPTVEPRSLLQQLNPPQHRQQRRAETVRTDEKEVDAEKSAAVETDSDEQEYRTAGSRG